MLVGPDVNHILERRLQAAGCQVVTAADNPAAFHHARHQFFDAAVLVSKGPLIDITETIFNLRDLNGSMEIIIVLDRFGRQNNRYLRRFLEHPIEGTQLMTRRQLQKKWPRVSAAPRGPTGGKLRRSVLGG